MTGVQTCALPISENRVHVASPSAGYARHPNETCRGRQDLAAGIASRDAAARGSTRLSLAAWWNRRRSRRCRSCGSLNSCRVFNVLLVILRVLYNFLDDEDVHGIDRRRVAPRSDV